MKYSPDHTLTKREPHELSSALENPVALQHRLEGKELAVFLDYDGCLSPIVQNPEDAILAEDMKSTLHQLANLCPVAVVSGRDRQNVFDLVQLDNVYYAGSHGYDITGPGNMQSEPGSAKEIVPELDQAETELHQLLQNVPGALVERKKYAIAVHYRNVDGAQEEKVKRAVDAVLNRHPKLKKGPGKKVVELKPNLDWHKGKAVEWLLKELQLQKPEVVPVFVGDDLTDEDAFAALQHNGITVLVGAHDEKTYAEFGLKDVSEVQQFLENLIRHASQGNTQASRH